MVTASKPVKTGPSGFTVRQVFVVEDDGTYRPIGYAIFHPAGSPVQGERLYLSINEACKHLDEIDPPKPSGTKNKPSGAKKARGLHK